MSLFWYIVFVIFWTFHAIEFTRLLGMLIASMDPKYKKIGLGYKTLHVTSQKCSRLFLVWFPYHPENVMNIRSLFFFRNVATKRIFSFKQSSMHVPAVSWSSETHLTTLLTKRKKHHMTQVWHTVHTKHIRTYPFAVCIYQIIYYSYNPRQKSYNWLAEQYIISLFPLPLQWCHHNRTHLINTG